MNHFGDIPPPSAVSDPGFPVKTPIGPLERFGAPAPPLTQRPDRRPAGSGDKLLPSLEAAFDRFDIGDGHVLSFHHHYRNGDRLMNAVIALAQSRGIKGLTLCPSSIFPVHGPLVSALRDGTITGIVTDYMRGPLADAIMEGDLAQTALLQTHGGRARALSAGQIDIDVALVAAPIAHVDGTATGRAGALACGPLGYAAVDARYAKNTVVLAHEVVCDRLPFQEIPAKFVDAVVRFDHPGDRSGIQSGSTVPSETPAADAIGHMTARAIEAAGALTNGMSLQSGAGGFSLGAVPIIGALMAQNGVRGSFLSGGITAAHTRLLEQGQFDAIHDVQCFDLAAVRSSQTHPAHHAMSAMDYASPLNPNARVNALSIMLLGAAEVDLDFNVNVVTGADGSLLGGPGGHPDTAAGAKLSIVTTALTGGGFAKIVPKVQSLTTLGQDVDMVITERGIAVNSRRAELGPALKRAGLPVMSIEALAAKSAEAAHRQAPPRPPVPPRVLIEHRNGTVLDWV